MTVKKGISYRNKKGAVALSKIYTRYSRISFAFNLYFVVDLLTATAPYCTVTIPLCYVTTGRISAVNDALWKRVRKLNFPRLNRHTLFINVLLMVMAYNQLVP